MDWDGRRLGRHLKLRDLNVLMTVAQCGTMGKAAAQLSVSQPAISQAIGDMERTLGVPLLDRSPQGVKPTIYASALLDHGAIAFDELRQAIRQIEWLADPTVGDIRIGCSVVLAEGFVATAINRFSQRYPRVTLHLLAEESGLIYSALEERKVDLAILLIFEPVAKAHLTTELLYDEPHVVAAGANNPWSKRRRIRLADLTNEPWVLPPLDSLTGSIVQEAFRAAGVSVPDAAIVTSSTPARYTLVAAGRFLSILPASMLTFARKKPAAKALPVEWATTPRRPIGIVMLKNRALSPVAQRFLDCARSVAKTAGDN
jgi:DNA-binding transcriptional LysR family regulator